MGIHEYKALQQVPVQYDTKHSKEGIPIPCKCPDCQSRDVQLTKYNDKYDWSIECLSCNQVIENVIDDGTVNPKYAQWIKFSTKH